MASPRGVDAACAAGRRSRWRETGALLSSLLEIMNHLTALFLLPRRHSKRARGHPAKARRGGGARWRRSVAQPTGGPVASAAGPWPRRATRGAARQRVVPEARVLRSAFSAEGTSRRRDRSEVQRDAELARRVPQGRGSLSRHENSTTLSPQRAHPVARP